MLIVWSYHEWLDNLRNGKQQRLLVQIKIKFITLMLKQHLFQEDKKISSKEEKKISSKEDKKIRR